MGGYIAADEVIVDAIRSWAPGFIFTTSLAPALAAGARASVEYLKSAYHLREQHQERAATLKARFHDAGIPVLESVTHIVPVHVGDPVLCKRMTDELLDVHGIYVQPINYPTVPKGTERMRLTPTPMHDDAMMDELLDAVKTVYAKHVGLKVA
jgi:5-aminolevulinate synthase